MKPFKYIKNLSLKSKSIVIFLFLAVMPIGAVSFLYYYQFNNILEQQVIDTSQRNLNAMQSNFLNLLNEVEDLSEYIIFNDEFNQYMTLDPDTADQEEISRLNRSLQAFLTFHITNNPYFNSITVTGNNRMVIHMGENIEQETEWKEKAGELDGSVLWSTHIIFIRDGRPKISRLSLCSGR
ncbi:hypothetical protein [Sinobaca sp. H24]|uniref:hypothetical protein n=1 Tax=Sinobaca sp. H24 TaxID=2923376 RepID=UPI00207A4273|nr:hypothetical protein [Sinobaca sp. H24]